MTPQRSYDTYWAKSDRGGSGAWRPFVEHVAPVTLVAEALLQACPYWISALSTLTGWSHTQVRMAVLYAAAAHDLGKLDVGFICQVPDLFCQTYPEHDPAPARSYYGFEDRKRSYFHGTHGPARLQRYVQGGELQRAYEEHVLLLQAAAGHHGFYPKADRQDSDPLDPMPVFEPLDRAAMLEFFSEVESLYGSDLPTLRLEPARLYAALDVIGGIVVLSDWIGSSEAAFPLKQSWVARSFTDAMNDTDLRRDAVKAVVDNGLFLAIDPKPMHQIDLDRAFGCTGFKPSPFQEFVAGLTDAPFVLVEGPTGEGKTEAGLLRFLGMLQGRRIQRFGMAMPTRSTANAMASRIDRFLKEVNRTSTRTLLAHSSAALARRFARQDQGNHAEDTVPKFFEPTIKSMLAPSWCATIDQVFLAFLKGAKHHMVRGLAVATAPVIYDEIHGCSVYMSKILDQVLRFQGSAAVPVTLLSATLPPDMRKRLLLAYREGMGMKAPVTLEADGYPLVTWIDAKGEVHQRSFAPRRSPRSTRLKLIRHGWERGANGMWQAAAADEEALLRSLIKTFDHGACAGWVRNTVADVQRLAPWVLAARPELRSDLFVLHASLNKYDLEGRQEELLRRLGPRGARRPTLVFGTQILEESFDIDFDRLVRDFAPADAQVQARGRHHRHYRSGRPPGYEVPLFEIFLPERLTNPKNPSKGQFGLLELIYSGGHVPLHRTYRWLLDNEGGRFQDPADVPTVMQHVFSSALSPEEARDPYLLAAHRRDEEHKMGKGAVARLAVITPYKKVRAVMPDDGDPKTRPWTRDGFFATDILVLVEEGLTLRVPHRQDMIDLRPFAHLRGASKTSIKAALRQHRDLWTRVLKIVHQGCAHRSRIRQGDTARVLSRQGEGVQLFQALWEAAGDHPQDLLVVGVSRDSGRARVSRIREGQTRVYSVGYDRDVGLLVEI